LISITGGKDLTLYEVDEAATRIREEVDQEANIIVGATFDEGLEGITRVSVVATGIDHVATAARPTAESRVAELTQKLKADTQRLTERFEQAPRATTQIPAQPLAAPQRSSVEQAATAAVAAALAPTAGNEDVTIRPIAPKPSLFMEPTMADPPLQETPKAFIPPQAERPQSRAPRMPRIDELPIPAQNEMRAQRGELQEDHPEKRRLTLLQRLASVGLGRREGEETQAPPAPRAATPQTIERLPPLPQTPVRVSEARPEPVSEYARRAAPQGLDQHGRQAPVHKSVDEDQLEIPAFLRRQAN
jgi:cell division protein FtsZ